jgi:hypothetical protein
MELHAGARMTLGSSARHPRAASGSGGLPWIIGGPIGSSSARAEPFQPTFPVGMKGARVLIMDQSVRIRWMGRGLAAIVGAHAIGCSDPPSTSEGRLRRGGDSDERPAAGTIATEDPANAPEPAAPTTSAPRPAQPMTPTQPTPPAPTLSITCPASARQGETVTCTASSVAAFVSGYWTANGARLCDNELSCVAPNVSAGTYVVQAIGTTAAGVVVASNQVTVDVAP